MSHTKNNIAILVVIGPSGAGKSTIINMLSEDSLINITPTWTTRPPRPGEVEMGVEHHFASAKEFEDKKTKDYFLETATMFGLPYIYGLPKIDRSDRSKVPLVMLRASLIRAFEKHYSNYIIYQIEDNISNVEKRLKDRLAKGENMGTRLSDYKKEVELGRRIANRVFVNTDLGVLYSEVKRSIQEDFIVS